MSNDPLMEQITAGIEQLHAGKREEARATFSEIWGGMEDHADPFHVCILSHYMADAQDHIGSELEWDCRALEAADRVTDERVKEHHASLSIKSFYPSLHLNAGDAFLRFGDVDRASVHVRAAESALQDLPHSPLGEMTRNGIAALAQRVENAIRDR
jgi:hypothetical protein